MVKAIVIGTGIVGVFVAVRALRKNVQDSVERQERYEQAVRTRKHQPVRRRESTYTSPGSMLAPGMGMG